MVLKQLDKLGIFVVACKKFFLINRYISLAYFKQKKDMLDMHMNLKIKKNQVLMPKGLKLFEEMDAQLFQKF